MNRRWFLKAAGAVLAAALTRFPPRVVAVEPKKAVGAGTAVSAAVPWSEPFAEKLAGESIWYEIIFFHFFRAAYGKITFEKGRKPGTYIGTAVGRAVGLVTWLTDYVEIGLETLMDVREVEGRPRLVATKFKYHSIRTDISWASDHRFDYTKRYWHYVVLQNGTRTKKRRRKIPDGKFYDDLMAVMYNMRLGGYGPIEKGRDFRFDTIPIGGIKEFDAHICKDDELSEDERDALKRLPGAEYVFRLPIDKKVFGIKAGMGRFFGSNGASLLGASVDDALGFANVFARLITDPAQIPAEWKPEGWPGRVSPS